MLAAAAALRVQVTPTHFGDAAKTSLQARVARRLVCNAAAPDMHGTKPVRIALRRIDLANALGV